MGDVEAEVWGSDCLPAQLKAKADWRQLCLAHQLRNLQAVVDLYSRACGGPKRCRPCFGGPSTCIINGLNFRLNHFQQRVTAWNTSVNGC